MTGFTEEINAFFSRSGFAPDFRQEAGFGVYRFRDPDLTLITVPITARTLQEAEMQQSALSSLLAVRSHAIVLPEDRFRADPELFEKRILAHLGRFRPVFARNCSLRRITKTEAGVFLDRHHSYGKAAARYHYGLFFSGTPQPGPQEELVAAASFSNARRLILDGQRKASYEWVRYASLPDVRVIGGMGKILKGFIREVHPEDVMSYADREWSEGAVYRKLGFQESGIRDGIPFRIDPLTWQRTPLGKDRPEEDGLFYRNPGSIKYRLTL